MKKYRTAMTAAVATLTAVVLLAPASLFGQSDADKAKARAEQRARGIALNRENNSQVLRLYDRQGKAVATINEKDFYNQPTISPDKTRIAVIRNNPETETQDAWVIEVATGQKHTHHHRQPTPRAVASAGLVS
jgi:hypothetical protein